MAVSVRIFFEIESVACSSISCDEWDVRSSENCSDWKPIDKDRLRWLGHTERHKWSSVVW